MGNKLSWLHISDIHFSPKTDWRDSAIRQALLDHLVSLFSKEQIPRPDLIFCTGDVAFGNSTETPIEQQYVQAGHFFDALLSACGTDGFPLERTRLFLVPGNHDVDRKQINNDAQATLNTWAKNSSRHIEQINQRFDEKTTEFKDAIKRLELYDRFIAQYLPHLHDDQGRVIYSREIELDGTRIGIAGFNSAWTCSGPEDDRNIWMAAKWQFNAAATALKTSAIRIGLIHHPLDWLNPADRDIATRRMQSEFDFCLHGHSHSAWVIPGQNHIVIAAGGVGVETSDEFGFNFVQIDLQAATGIANLYGARANENGWTVMPTAPAALDGKWNFELPQRLRRIPSSSAPPNEGSGAREGNVLTTSGDTIARFLKKRLDDALRVFASQPSIWVTPTLSVKAETDAEAKVAQKLDCLTLLNQSNSTIVKAPPQYGLTCLAHYLIHEAWRLPSPSRWIYIDARSVKANPAAIQAEVHEEIRILGCSEAEIECIVLDSWAAYDKDSLKLLRILCEKFPTTRVICMQQSEGNLFGQLDVDSLPRKFDTYFLWALSRTQIRKIVAAYNEQRDIGDEDAITTKLAGDLDALNLHRTPLNCITLLKVSEVDFDDSPVNRCEIIKRVLFLLFNIYDVPTYKVRPDLKDCEYVLGYFCEQLVREDQYFFARDRFLSVIQQCCQERLIDLETHIVFDILYENSIIVKRGSFFCFRFSYWIYYFAAHRMLQNTNFADFIFENFRYAKYPEIIEFYTGIDRAREDALKILTNDLAACVNKVKEGCGLPEDLNPYRHAQWIPSPKVQTLMQTEIAEGIKGSNLPSAVKDQYADQYYDQSKPYDQSIRHILAEHSFVTMLQTMTASARALRNSDYVSPETKRALLQEILNAWEQASMVLLVLLPILAVEGRAAYDGINVLLVGDFGKTLKERAMRILTEIPRNVVCYSEYDLFSKKMGPLLFDRLEGREIGALVKHELVLLLIRQRPRDWNKHVQRYIASVSKNSFFLFDVYRTLRVEYQYSFTSFQSLKDIELLIRMAATKHVTGEKEPGKRAMKKVKFETEIIPPRTPS